MKTNRYDRNYNRNNANTFHSGLHILINQKLHVDLLTPHIRYSTVNYVDMQKKTTLMKLIENNYEYPFIENILKLLTKNNLHKKDSNNKNALEYCFEKTKMMTMEKLIQTGYDKLQLTLSYLKVEPKVFITYMNTTNTDLLLNSFLAYSGNKKELYDLMLENISIDTYENIFKIYINHASSYSTVFDFVDKFNKKIPVEKHELITNLFAIDQVHTLQYILTDIVSRNKSTNKYIAYKCNFDSLCKVLMGNQLYEKKHLDFLKILCDNTNKEIIQQFITNNISDYNQINPIYKCYYMLRLHNRLKNVLVNENINCDDFSNKMLLELDNIKSINFNMLHDILYDLYKINELHDFIDIENVNENIKHINEIISDKFIIKMFSKITNIDIDHLDKFFNGNCHIREKYTDNVIELMQNKVELNNEQIYKIMSKYSEYISEKLLESFLNQLSENFKCSGLFSRDTRVNLAWKYYQSYKKSPISCDIVYKLITFAEYLNHTGNFVFDYDLTKVLIEKYKPNDSELGSFLVTISDQGASEEKFQLLQYLCGKIKNINEISLFRYFINYIPTHREYVLSLYNDNVDVDEKIYASQHYMSRLTLIEKLINVMVTNNFKDMAPFIENLIEKSSDIALHKNISYIELIAMNVFPDDLIKRLLNTNGDDLVSRFFGNYNSHSVTINAMDPLESVAKYIQQPETMNTFWKIKYQDQSGIDGGGLIRDFYYILGDEIKKHMKIVDNYYYLNEDNKNDTDLWFKIGLMFGKMFVIEKLPCGINLHPYLLYRITHPDFESTKMVTFDNNWFCDIENIKSIHKLYQMDDQSWNTFIESSGDVINDNQMNYCNKLLLEEYENKFQPALNEFVYGFWSYADAMLLKYFDNTYVGKKICGSLKYKIFGDESGSLQKSMKYKMDNKYINGLFNAIEKLNNEDNDKIQKLFRFWFGSPYVDLTGHSISYEYGSKKEVFEAHTCFYQLVLPNPKYYPNIVNDEKECTKFMEKLIENTIYNQDLADQYNLHTQYR